MKKTILDLCGGTGSWSKPYKDAGYDVRVITMPEWDVRKYQPPVDVYGILAAPPCTHFSGSGARWWPEKDKDGRTLEDLEIATACLMLITRIKPKFWAIENPVGRLKRWFGKPVMYFNPCDFGDPYTKKTCLWGEFKTPVKTPVEPEFMVASNGKRFSKIHWYTGGKSVKTKEKRSITPQGFANAFFLANQ
jgi:site-specific DNA-cytosine methylase